MIKVIGFVRILSIVLFLIVLGLVYAYLPVMVKVLPENDFTIHRENFFYYITAAFFIINAFTWALVKMLQPLLLMKRGETTTAWFNSISVVINVYLALLLGFVGVLNNPLHIAAGSYAYLNFLGPILIVAWLVGFFYLNRQKKSTT